MNQPGTLRHSKAHREIVKRQWARQMVRFELVVPMRRFKGLTAADMREWLALPAGAVVRAQAITEFGQNYCLTVDIPRSAKLVIDSAVNVKRRGPVVKDRVDWGHITQMQREDWAAAARRPLKFSRFGPGY